MRYQDWRVSPHFVLSDFLNGLPTLASKVRLPAHTTVSSEVMRNARHLAETLLEPLLLRWGPLSLGKGFVPEPLASTLFRETAREEFPEKFADRYGAGVDATFHRQIEADVAPIDLCHSIDRELPSFHRLTAHGSQIHLNSRADGPDLAIYEHHPSGKRTFHGKGVRSRSIRTNAMKRPEPCADWKTEFHWKKVDWHRCRVSPHFMVTDFCFSDARLARGEPPVIAHARSWAVKWAEVLDPVKAVLGHISVTHVEDDQIVFLLPQHADGLPGMEHPAIVNIEQKDHPSETRVVRLTVRKFDPRCKHTFMDGTLGEERPSRKR